MDVHVAEGPAARATTAAIAVRHFLVVLLFRGVS
jgi:hypothetical protein